jgi:hypothetical protein
LSDEFYKEVIAHPIPADIEAVKAFGSAPAVLDLFMWITYRCFTAKSEERIPLFGDFGLTAQLGSVEYTRPRRFRAMLEHWLGQVRTVWRRNVQRRSARMADICDSVRRKQYCRPRLNTLGTLRARRLMRTTMAPLWSPGPETSSE